MAKPKRSHFNLSHNRFLTCNIGQLTPILCEEVLPGDKFSVNTEMLLRLMPLQTPIMSHLDTYVRYFFVPNRILWKDWETFIVGQSKVLSGTGINVPSFDLYASNVNNVSSNFNHYQFYLNGSSYGSTAFKTTVGVFGKGSLFDYLTGTVWLSHGTNSAINDQFLNLLPFAAYQEIYNWYFRDQNFEPVIGHTLGTFSSSTDLTNSNFVTTSDTWQGETFFPSISNPSSAYPIHSYSGLVLNAGLNSSDLLTNLMSLRCCNWASDYFIDSMPWAQRGSPVTVVSTGLSGTSDVYYDGSKIQYGESVSTPVDKSSWPGFRKFNGVPYSDGASDESQVFGSNRHFGVAPYSGTSSQRIRRAFYADTGNGNYDAGLSTKNYTGYDPNGTLKVDSVDADTGITVNDIRTAFQVQRFLERSGRAGIRYVEQLLAHFGVHSSNARLDMPEYLGGGKLPVQISEVMNNTGANTPANLYGKGISAGHLGGFHNKFFEEHGYVIGLVYVRPKAAYNAYMPRTFLKNAQYDFAFPEFAHIGEQPVQNYEMSRLDGTINEDAFAATFGYVPRYEEYRRRVSTTHGEFNDTLLNWTQTRNFGYKAPVHDGLFQKCMPNDAAFHRVFQDTDVSHDKILIMLRNHVHAKRPLPKFGRPGMVDHF